MKHGPLLLQPKEGSRPLKTEFGERYVDKLMIIKMHLGDENLTKSYKTN